MTREELNKLIMQACERTWNEKTCKEIEQALAQEPCENVISREDLEECKELMTDINGDTVYAVRMSDIRHLPPVTQKSGKWIDREVYDAD